eukprot:5515310-Pleurochrysis_carterae.AAC.1
MHTRRNGPPGGRTRPGCARHATRKGSGGVPGCNEPRASRGARRGGGRRRTNEPSTRAAGRDGADDRRESGRRAEP